MHALSVNTNSHQQIDYPLLYQARDFFGDHEMPFMNELNALMLAKQPYRGLKVIHNIHLTLSTICKIIPLLLSGADVTVTGTHTLTVHPEALRLIKKAGVKWVNENQISDDYDIALDCCAGLLHKVNPRIGTVELTQTGVHHYKNYTLPYPVISVDNSVTKNLETFYGTGDGFVRALQNLTNEELNKKNFVIFGYGKVGKGVVHALSAYTTNIIVIEKRLKAIHEARNKGLVCVNFNNHNEILNILDKGGFCGVTATGENGIISESFNKADFQNFEYLANIGSEDEFGVKFSSKDVLFNKNPINFSLADPTLMKYLDPIFYAHNHSIDILLSKKFTPGVHNYPKTQDQYIIKKWFTYHQLTPPDIF